MGVCFPFDKCFLNPTELNANGVFLPNLFFRVDVAINLAAGIDQGSA